MLCIKSERSQNSQTEVSTHVSTRAQGGIFDDGLVQDTNEAPYQAENPKAFDLLYIPFIQKFDPQNEESERDFFQKVYELLAPLRGLLVITIIGIGRSDDNTAIMKGLRISRLLNQSGIPASNIRVITSHRHNYVLANRNDRRDLFKPSPGPLPEKDR